MVVHQLARVKREVSVFYNQIWDALVEVCDLWYFGVCEKFLKVVDLSANGIVVIREIVRTQLQVFCSLNNAKWVKNRFLTIH